MPYQNMPFYDPADPNSTIPQASAPGERGPSQNDILQMLRMRARYNWQQQHPRMQPQAATPESQMDVPQGGFMAPTPFGTSTTDQLPQQEPPVATMSPYAPVSQASVGYQQPAPAIVPQSATGASARITQLMEQLRNRRNPQPVSGGQRAIPPSGGMMASAAPGAMGVKPNQFSQNLSGFRNRMNFFNGQ